MTHREARAHRTTHGDVGLLFVALTGWLEIRSVYPNVQEGTLRLGLMNWPEEGMDTEGAFDACKASRPAAHEPLADR